MSRTESAAPPAAAAAAAPTRAPGGRDLRLDFFRGLALWFIFIDHIPSSYIGNLTFRNFGFSDATEIFVFISGYTAAMVYGATLDKGGFLYMSVQVAKRVWQLYAAHILVFIFFIGQILWVTMRFGQAGFLDELNVAVFLNDPMQSIIDALILRYRPVNLDVLPMYIVLLAGIPLILVLMRVSRLLTLLLSLALWWGVQQYQWAFPIYDDGHLWYFNPLGWQLLFVIGALCASVRGQSPAWMTWRPWLAWVCVAYLIFAAVIAIGWRVPAIDEITKPLVYSWLYPIDKTNMGPARVLHFLAVAYLVAHFVRPNARLLSSKLAQPVIRCGQHSLYIFCLGISLSFLAHFVLVEFGRSLPMQLVVVFGGLTLMTALASQLHWYRTRSRAASTRPQPPSAPPAIAPTPAADTPAVSAPSSTSPATGRGSHEH
ncbi:MAG: OpgC domain-containing protein [Lautropia sp.]|nr:OpgC domain-containing protein [Lautropia sp.]